MKYLDLIVPLWFIFNAGVVLGVAVADVPSLLFVARLSVYGAAVTSFMRLAVYLLARKKA